MTPGEIAASAVTQAAEQAGDSADAEWPGATVAFAWTYVSEERVLDGTEPEAPTAVPLESLNPLEPLEPLEPQEPHLAPGALLVVWPEALPGTQVGDSPSVEQEHEKQQQEHVQSQRQGLVP